MSERKVEVHRVEVLIVDHDGVGAEGVASVLESVKYPNWCIHPKVRRVDTRTVDWTNDHPLNYEATAEEAYRELFAEKVDERTVDDGHGNAWVMCDRADCGLHVCKAQCDHPHCPDAT